MSAGGLELAISAVEFTVAPGLATAAATRTNSKVVPDIIGRELLLGICKWQGDFADQQMLHTFVGSSAFEAC